jgi:Spy/CpxP family protein refolding chaperone
MRSLSVLLCALFVALAAAPAGAQPAPRPGGPPPAWWTSERFKQDLHLTKEQSARIEQIVQASLPQLKDSKDSIDREEAVLSKLMAAADANEAEVLLAIDRVETARYTMSKARTVMLFRVNRVLSAEQRAKLQEIHQRDGADRARPTR